ncbi:hypothetical protein [Bacillus bombysepticus]
MRHFKISCDVLVYIFTRIKTMEKYLMTEAAVDVQIMLLKKIHNN